MAALIAFGSNMGDRLAHFRAGRAALAELLGPVTAVSPIFVTPPWDCEEGAEDFYNAVVEFDAPPDPRRLLRVCQETERARGRPADHARHVSRPLDLDLLSVDDLIVGDLNLILPHPRIKERMFVLAPLSRIRPERRMPGADASVAEWLEERLAHEILPDVVAEIW